jgi:uncharacterized repeat protein (TIGR04052 family)
MQRIPLVLLLVTHALAGCGDDEPSELDAGTFDAGTFDASRPGLDAAPDTGAPGPEDAGPKLQPVTIRFAGRVGTADFACGANYANQGTTAATITPVDLRFYVQDLKLVTASGVEVAVAVGRRDPWQAEGVALIDLEDATGACFASPGTNREITGHVPQGSYVGLRFANGVPESLNHGEPATLPPALQAPGMNWSWLLGYRFVKAEVRQVLHADAGALAHLDAGADGGADASVTPGFNLVHTGAVACSGNVSVGNVQCSKPNRNLVRLDGFDPDRNVVVVDVGALFGASDLRQDEECHSGAEVCAPMVRLGIDIDTGQPLAAQQVYRVE